MLKILNKMLRSVLLVCVWQVAIVSLRISFASADTAHDEFVNIVNFIGDRTRNSCPLDLVTDQWVIGTGSAMQVRSLGRGSIEIIPGFLDGMFDDYVFTRDYYPLRGVGTRRHFFAASTRTQKLKLESERYERCSVRLSVWRRPHPEVNYTTLGAIWAKVKCPEVDCEVRYKGSWQHDSR